MNTTSMNRLEGLKRTVFASLLLGSFSAQAAWVVEPVVEASTGYDDNVRLTNVDQEDAIISEVAGEVRLRQVTERSEISALLGASYLAYSATDADLKNEDAQYLGVDARRLIRTGNFGIRGRYTRDLILRRLAPISGVLSASAADFDAAIPVEPLEDPFDQLDIETNATVDQVRRQRWSLEPYLNWDFSERNSLNLAYRYYDRSFQDGEEAGLRDTSESEILVGVQREMSPRLTGGIRVGVANFKAAGLGAQEDGEADNYSGTVGINYLLTPRTILGIDIGASHTENDTENLSETQAIWDLRLTRNLPTSRVSVGWNRGTEPSVFGGLVRADRVVANYQQSLSERWEFAVAAYAYSTEAVGGTGTARDKREYFDVAPRITWRVTQSWNLGALYRYRWSDRTFDDAGLIAGSADGNMISLFVSYQPPRQI